MGITHPAPCRCTKAGSLEVLSTRLSSGPSEGSLADFD